MNWLEEALLDRARVNTKAVEHAKSVPQPVLDALDKEDVGEFITDIKQMDSEKFVVGYHIILPYHGWDLNESNVSLETINLVCTHNADVMGGIGFEIHEKENDEEPAYAWAFYWEEYSVVWMEF